MIKIPQFCYAASALSVFPAPAAGQQIPCCPAESALSHRMTPMRRSYLNLKIRDEDKDKEQLIKELKRLRSRIIKLKVTEIRYRRAKKLLKKSRKQYSIAFKEAKLPILWIDAEEGKIINCNQAAEFFLEKTKEEIVGQPQISIHPPEKAEFYFRIFKIQTDEKYAFAYEDKSGFAYDAEILTKSGEIIPVHISASVSSFGKKRVIQQIFRDITKYKQSENALKNALNFSERLIDNTPYPIFCKDRQGVYLNCNTAFARFVGAHKSKIIGKTDFDIFPREVGELFRKKDEEALGAEKPKISEEWVSGPGGGKKSLIETLRGVYSDAEGNTVGVVGISRDITESRKISDMIKKADIINRKNIMEAFKKATKNVMVAQQQLKIKNTRLNETLEKVEEANKKIMDSIRYAKVIQSSLLPNLDGSNIYLPESFVIWMPKDVVGGDIFFKDSFTEGTGADEYMTGFIFAVIDCTGHGVPGAFMTMIASSGLRRIIKDEGCHDPARILKQLNFIVKKSLQQDRKDTLSNDGLDAAICFVKIQKKTDSSDEEDTEKILIFAGAKLPLIYVCDNEAELIKGDKESIGYKKSDLNFDFTNHTIHIKKGMSFYIFTDGFTDQLGGEKRRRFGTTRFKNLLRKNAGLPFEVQRKILLQAFEEYKGENERQDDVTILGFGF
jgi:PAS domain S-box-containing protein